MHKLQKWLTAATMLAWIAASAPAQATSTGVEGRILNADGAWCWYTQTVMKRASDFLILPGRIVTMHFEDPQCMGETTQEGLDFAAAFIRTQVAQTISNLVRGAWVRDDVVYDPENRFQPGDVQKTGECIVDTRMPATAIAINFVSNGTSITKVEYAHVFGCGEPLPESQ